MVPTAGVCSAAVTFTPADTANYHPVADSVNVAVAKATKIWDHIEMFAFDRMQSLFSVGDGFGRIPQPLKHHQDHLLIRQINFRQ